MTQETFEKVIPLLTLVREECFYFSCLYEPTLNKNMETLIRMIPQEQRKKCFFTTNLAVHMPDSLIDFLSASGLHHINISMESLDRPVYENICEHADFDTYSDNLKRIAAVFAKHPDAPKLRFITMILRENYRQLADMAVRAHDEYHADLHEFRTPYVGPHMNLPWLDGQILTREELDHLEHTLRGLSVPVAIDTATSTENYHEIIEGKRKSEIYGDEHVRRLPDQHTLRIHSDGRIVMDENGTAYNLSDIPDPREFFLKKLADFCREAAAERLYRDDMPKTIAERTDAAAMIDEVTDTDGIVTVTGWTFLENTDMTDYDLLLRAEPAGEGRDGNACTCRVTRLERPDVEAAYHSGKCRHSGFQAVFDRTAAGSELRLVMLYRPRRDSGMWYAKTLNEIFKFS